MDDHDNSRISNKKVIHQLINFTIKHRKIMMHYLDETGVYQSQHRLLMAVACNPYASQKDIADTMDISTATVAVSLKKLEKGGYINRVADEADNRINKITITEKGNRVVEQSRQIFETTDRKVFEGFTEKEMLTLSALLHKLDANLTRMEAEINQKKKGFDV
ncbi:MAG TPA: MarR family transcriptional regulator [Candidatus Atribacteria bacterium]|nr:MarR family transcriptional regulator [Candidatus Atribacteria bacterium]